MIAALIAIAAVMTIPVYAALIVASDADDMDENS